MKTYLLDILNKISRYRDWALLLMVGAGIFFFMQQSKAVEQLNPDEIWQTKWKEVGSPPPPPEDAAAKGPLNAPSHSSDIFKPVQLKDIESISSNPIWTPAGDYTSLKVRLESLRKEYQDANTRGDAKTARDKLVQYCKEDPKGRILQWPNPPQTILTNLVCEQTNQSLLSSMESGKTASQNAASAPESDLDKTLDALNDAYANLKAAVDEANSHPECAESAEGASQRLSEAKAMLESIGQTRDATTQRLLKTGFDSIAADGDSIKEDTPPESVAQVLDRIRQFRDRIKNLDPASAILDQSQIAKLQEIQTKVESGKDSRIAKVRENIGQLTANPAYKDDQKSLNDILGMFNILEKLGDSKAGADRREYETLLQKLEAVAIVQEMNTLLDSVGADMDAIKAQIEAKQDTAATAAKIDESMARLEELRKKPSVRRAPGGPEASKRWTTMSGEWKRIKQKLK